MDRIMQAQPLVPLNDWYDDRPQRVVTRETWEESQYSREKKVMAWGVLGTVSFGILRAFSKLAENRVAIAVTTVGFWSCVVVTGVAVLIGLTGGVPVKRNHGSVFRE